MKKFRIFSYFLLLCLLLSAVSPVALAAETPAVPAPLPAVTAQSWIIVDLNTGEVIAEHNADAERSPASLTKIMTGLLAVEAVESEADPLTMDEVVTAGFDCQTGLDSSSSNASIVAGEKMSFRDFFYCAMVVSANEACNVIGTRVSGSIGGFVDRMNSRAAELGLEHTHFVDPNGLSYDNTTTARELSLILQEALRHEDFLEAFTTSEYTVPKTNYNDPRELVSTDALTTPNSYYSQYGDFLYEPAIGAKTGFTRRAGYCLASVAEMKERDLRVMIIVLGCPGPLTGDSAEPESFNDTISLYRWVFDEQKFRYREVLNSSESITKEPLPVNQAEGDATVNLYCTDSLTLLLPEALEIPAPDIEIYQDRLTAPIPTYTVLGSLKLSIDGKTYGPYDLVNHSEIKMAKTEIIQDKVNEFFLSREVIIIGIVLVVIVLMYLALVLRYRALHRKHLREKRRMEKRREAARRQRMQQNESNPESVQQPTQRFTAIRTAERSADAIDLARFFDEPFRPEQKPLSPTPAEKTPAEEEAPAPAEKTPAEEEADSLPSGEAAPETPAAEPGPAEEE